MGMLKQTIGEGIKAFRIARGFSQESLGASQSYISQLEKGVIKNATLLKLDQVGGSMGVHPLSLAAAAYRLAYPEVSREELLERVARELSEIGL